VTLSKSINIWILAGDYYFHLVLRIVALACIKTFGASDCGNSFSCIQWPYLSGERWSSVTSKVLKPKYIPVLPPSQRYKRPYHGTPDNEPGFVPFPWVLIWLPEFWHRTNHVPGNNVKLYADSPGLISLLIVIEPQTAFEGAYGQTNTSYSARSATGKK